MKRELRLAATAVALAAAGFFVESCKQSEGLAPSAEFAQYISAYTGGVVSNGSAIAVELMEGRPDGEWQAAAVDGIFTFSPSMKGTVRWRNANTLEFVPDDGEMKSGTAYKASFNLGKIMDVDKKYSKFGFSFRVVEKAFKITVQPISIQSDNSITVSGSLNFNEMAKLEEAKRMIAAEFDGEDVAVAVDGPGESRAFQFEISGITRGDEYQLLNIDVDGRAAGIDRTESISVGIPAKGNFYLSEMKIVASPEYGLRIVFSDLISESQDLKGMVVLKGISGYTVQVQGNQLMAYFSHPKKMKELEVVVDQGLKNRDGEPLGKSQRFTLPVGDLKPQVELLSSGTIMPSSGKIALPFRAVALHAVDLKIIRIFEGNVLMFLQDNTLSGNSSSQLRRAGRLVCSKTLRLDDDPTKDLANWENYSIDLTGLVKQQPGAIYRIELSFKQAYASYECENAEAREGSLAGAVGLTRVLAEENAAGEEYWDKPDAYYYEGYDMDVDWDEYDWKEIDNPCDPTYYMQPSRKASTNVLASNIGMIAKSNDANTLWVAVNGLLDTKPVANAAVTAYNYQLQPIGSSTTDGDGFSSMSLKSKPFAVVASSKGQKAYLRVVDGEENMLSRFDVGGVELKKGLKGYVYGERGVWRPGDTLHVAFMLEDREKKIPSNHPVSFELFNPRGQFYKKLISTNGVNGMYAFNVPTKADDPTGLWNAYVKVGGATFHKSLRIEAIKPNRLKISLGLPKAIDASHGAAPASIHSQWLTGATARGLKAKMEITLSKVETQFKGYEEYTFNNPATRFAASRTEVFDGKLDGNGDASFRMKVPSAENAPGMLRANVTCRVFEPGGDASVASQSVPFSPYSSYVGINFNMGKDEYCMDTDEDHVFDIVTLDSEGRPVSRDNIEYKIYRIGWSWWWESENESEPFDSYINNTNMKPLFDGRVTTVNGKGSIKFRIDYPDWGRYLVYVKDMGSGHATGGTVLVDWPSWRGRSNKDDPAGAKMLSFSVDKASYDIGENVVVTIPETAFAERALVALENGTEVVRREWVELAAGSDTKYTFKVTEKMSPNIYIHVSLLLPHSESGYRPIRMYGVKPVFVSNEKSVLAPVITMADVLRPETDFEVKVKEQGGKPMTYTLAIVDDGLLGLTNFKTPDPWNEFYAREALGIRTWDVYDNVMGAFAGKYGSLFSVGGDADLNPSPEAKRFKPVVLYLGPVTLAAGGENKHTLRLPPYVGSVRVMVVAGQDGAYGKADKTVPVRTPLMVLPSLPRVLGTGEEIVLPVNVFAMENNVRNVTVKVETTGKLKAAGKSSQSLAFDAPGDSMVYFRMKTGAESGVEKVSVIAEGGGRTSKETVEIEVRNPNPPVLTYRSELLEKGQSAEFDYTLDDSCEGNWVKVEMSRIPTIDISRRFDYLHDYAHDCSEQLASRALPLLFLPDLTDLDEKEKEQTQKNIAEAINNLYRRQLPNGGLAYWPGDGYATDWATSYAGHFLVLAKERGYNVNSNVINKWIGYQRSAAQNWRTDRHAGSRYSYGQSDLQQAYRLYTLALAGAPEMGAMNRMKELKDLSQQARWRLAAAYALCGKNEAANELVFNASTTVMPYSSNNPTYGSYDRDEAMILETLVLMGKTEEAFRQAQKVSKNLSSQDYFCTQSTAYAMAAMGLCASKMSGKLDFEWSLNGKSRGKVDSGKAVFREQLPTSPRSGKLKVQNGHEGVLYVSVAAKTRPVVDDLPAMAENIRLDVSYTDMAGSAIDARNVSQGDDFYAVVRVSNISAGNYYTDVALTHIIPSGWEIYNERMVAASAADEKAETAKVPGYQDMRDDRILTYFDLPPGATKEIKVRLQASYIGDFALPAIQCEAMYDASARARTAAGRVAVKK